MQGCSFGVQASRLECRIWAEEYGSELWLPLHVTNDSTISRIALVEVAPGFGQLPRLPAERDVEDASSKLREALQFVLRILFRRRSKAC